MIRHARSFVVTRRLLAGALQKRNYSTSKIPKFASSSFPLSSSTYAAVVGVMMGTTLWFVAPPSDFYPTAGTSGTINHGLTRTPPPIPPKEVVPAPVEEVVIVEVIEKTESAETKQHAESTKQKPEKTETIVEEVHKEVVAPVKVTEDDSPAASGTDKLIKAHYLLVGGGTASYSAMKAIQERYPDADILIVTSEDHPPYMRPPLSKELWFMPEPSALRFKDWGGTERSTVFQDVAEYHIENGTLPPTKETGAKPARLLMGHAVVSIDTEAQTVSLDDGRTVKYTKVLLATGGSPKTLKHTETLPEEYQQKITTFRSINDLNKLDEVAKAGKKIVVVGGGFLGSELACAISRYGKKFGTSVTQVFPEQGNMGRVLPNYLTKWTTAMVSAEGVEVVPNKQIEMITGENDKLVLKLSDGSSVQADHVLLTLGITPNKDFAKKTDLEIDEIRDGIIVNAELEARSNVFVAGDLSSFHDITLGRRRVEHHDHAVLSGRWAGRNMTGASKPFKHQSMFWSDLGPSIGYEAVGILDSTLPTVSLWAKATPSDTPAVAAKDQNDIRVASPESLKESTERPETVSEPLELVSSTNPDEYGKGVVFYLKDDKIVGVLLWNMFHRTPIAQRVIREEKTVKDIKELAKMFQLHQK